MTDRLERPRVSLEAEAELENAPLTLGEGIERFADSLLAEGLLGLVERVRSFAVGEEIAELAFVVRSDALVQGDGRLGRAQRFVDVLNRKAGRLRELLLRRLAPELDLEPAGGPAKLLLALDDVDGNADGARVVGDGALHRLADPPGGVGRELEAPPPVEPLQRAVEAESPLLDQVQERDAEAPVALGDGDDETEVRLDHLPLGDEIALLDLLGERDLFRGGQKLVLADVREEELQAVAGTVMNVLRDRGGRRGLLLRLDRRADLEPERLELLGEVGHLLVAEVELEGKGLQLGRLNVATLLGVFDDGAALQGVQKFMHGVLTLTHVVPMVLSLKRCGRMSPVQLNVRTVRRIPWVSQASRAPYLTFNLAVTRWLPPREIRRPLSLQTPRAQFGWLLLL